MTPELISEISQHLESDPPRRFADWPDENLPKGPPGIYTLWAENVFLYVGISYKDRADTTNPAAAGVWGRLNTHVRGSRTGHLMGYVANRFVIPDLTRDDQEQLRRGETTLNARIAAWVHEHMSYRVIVCLGPEARAAEALIRRSGLPNAGLALFNSVG